MTNAINGLAKYASMTAGVIGFIAAILDDCCGLGDDDATDALCQGLLDSGVCETIPQAEQLAYHIVHDRKRQ